MKRKSLILGLALLGIGLDIFAFTTGHFILLAVGFIALMASAYNVVVLLRERHLLRKPDNLRGARQMKFAGWFFVGVALINVVHDIKDLGWQDYLGIFPVALGIWLLKAAAKVERRSKESSGARSSLIS